MGQRVYWFKSSPEIFYDEKSGKKNNTARIYNRSEGYDVRFEDLRNLFLSGKLAYIGIKNAKNKKEKFIRKIRHIAHMFNYPSTLHKSYEMFVITWNKTLKKK